MKMEPLVKKGEIPFDLRLVLYQDLATFMKKRMNRYKPSVQSLIKAALDGIELIHKILSLRKEQGISTPTNTDIAKDSTIGKKGPVTPKKGEKKFMPKKNVPARIGRTGLIVIKDEKKIDEKKIDVIIPTPSPPKKTNPVPIKKGTQMIEEPIQSLWNETPEQKAERFGNFYLTKGDYVPALKYFTDAVELNQTKAVYFYKRAVILNQLDYPVDSILELERAIERNPKFKKLYGLLAMQYFDLSMHEKAKEAFKQALSFDPTNKLFTTFLEIVEARLAEETNRATVVEPSSYYLDLIPRRYDPDVLHASRELIREPGSYNIIASMLNKKIAEPNPIRKILEYWIVRKQVGYNYYQLPHPVTIEEYIEGKYKPVRMLPRN